MSQEPPSGDATVATDDSLANTGHEHRIEEANEILARLGKFLESAEASFTRIEAFQSDATGILASLESSQTTALANLENTKVSATTDLQTIKATLTEIQARTAEVQAALPPAKESLQTSKELVKQISDIHEKSGEHASRIATLVPKVDRATQRVSEHEQDLADLKVRIEGLLPGATSAGLSKAFQDQKQQFIWPKRIWGGIFVASILALVAIAGYGAGGLLGNDAAIVWQSLLAYLLRRLPLAAPLVWLAYFAGRRYMDAERLQVDYGYKAAISSAFEGYKKQMSELGDELDLTSPIATLCNNQLRSIAEHPGRIYSDGHGKDITLATPIGELAQSGGEFAKQLASIPPATPFSEALPKILLALFEAFAKKQA